MFVCIVVFVRRSAIVLQSGDVTSTRTLKRVQMCSQAVSMLSDRVSSAGGLPHDMCKEHMRSSATYAPRRGPQRQPVKGTSLNEYIDD